MYLSFCSTYIGKKISQQAGKAPCQLYILKCFVKLFCYMLTYYLSTCCCSMFLFYLFYLMFCLFSLSLLFSLLLFLILHSSVTILSCTLLRSVLLAFTLDDKRLCSMDQLSKLSLLKSRRFEYNLMYLLKIIRLMNNG